MATIKIENLQKSFADFTAVKTLILQSIIKNFLYYLALLDVGKLLLLE
jgi:hypothetical protein